MRLSWASLYRQFGVDPAKASDKRTVDAFRTKCLRELKKIKTAWPDLNYPTAKGVLILSPAKRLALYEIAKQFCIDTGGQRGQAGGNPGVRERQSCSGKRPPGRRGCRPNPHCHSILSTGLCTSGVKSCGTWLVLAPCG